MKRKVRHMHFVGQRGAASSGEQGPRWGCDRPRVAAAAGFGPMLVRLEMTR